MRVLIETRDNGQHRSERELFGDSKIDSFLDELAECSDAILSFGVSEDGDEVELIVGITPKGYLITRFLDGDFQQLIGSPEAAGETELVLGGQSTPTSSRWLTARAETVRTLGSYIADSAYPNDQVWERP